MEVRKDNFVEVDSRVKTISQINTESNTESYFDGSLLELLAYNYLSYFITIFTAGICRSWGVCILNKYIYSHTVISGKRLKFEGQGDELFAKFFKWNFFRIITFGIYSIWVPTRYKEWEVSKLHFEDEDLISGDSYFTGSVGAYFGINLLCLLLTVISFGLLSPIANVIRLRWELEHTIINRKVVVFKGSAGEFFLKKILWLLLSIITFGIYSFWIDIKTHRWNVKNTFLLRKDDKNTANELTNESGSTSTISIPKEKKGTNKIVLFSVLGVVLVVVIILFVELISILKPVDPVIEEEMRNTFSKFQTEFVSDLNHEGGSSTYDYGKTNNIKKLNYTSIKEFIDNKGQGFYQDYYIESDGSGYSSITVTLRKKSTICKKSFNTYQSNSEMECTSIKDFIKEKLNISTSSSKTENGMNMIE